MNFMTSVSSGLRRCGGVFSHRRKPRYVYLLAFFLPIFVMGVLWAIHKVAPFGSKMILAHDQWHQYYPFYLDLRRRLLAGDSLLHSWTTGMGTSYLPLFAYYLASPLNYIAALLPENLAMLYYTFTVLLRIGLAGLFFAYFLRKFTDRSELIIAVFSTMYALSAFLMGYYWNAIWLDTVALLPLVVLGTLSLLRDRRCILYITSLTLAIFCSYYIGFFVCLFVLLHFIGYHIVEWDDLGGFGARLLRIGVCSLIAVGITAVLTLPTILGMQSTSSAENKFPDSNAMNMVSGQTMSAQEAVESASSGELAKLFEFFGAKPPEFEETKQVSVSWCGPGDAMTELRLGYLDAFFDSFDLPFEGVKIVLSNTGDLTAPTTMEGLPNIFCGFSTLIMALLFLFCKRISLRERIVTVALLLFFALSFLIRTLDYLWHGMHFPNMLPYRFSFLWCFMVIWMGYRAYSQLDTVRWWRVVLTAVPTALILLCILGGETEKRTQIVTCLVAAFVLAMLLLFSLKMIQKEHLALGLCLCMILEAAAGAALGVNKVSVTDSSYYPTQKEDTAAIVARMQEREADTVDLWRAEVANKQTLNDGTLLGYRGVSVFSSAANARVSKFLQTLGLAASVPGNRYAYQEADPFTNLLLGVKYLIDRNGRFTDPTYFEQVDQQGQVLLLENKYYLPLGFQVNDAALDYNVDDTAALPFERLNRLFRQMTGLEETLFTTFTTDGVEAMGSARITYQTGSTFGATAENADEENCAVYRITMPSDGHLCFYSKSSNTSDLVVFLNGERQYTYSDKYGYNRYMGRFNAGDEITLRYRPNANKTAHCTVGAALFRDDVFRRGYERLKQNTMLTTLVSDTEIEGAVRMQEAGLIYTSIPYDDGWTVTVDGESVRITPVGDAMIAFRVEPGLHAVSIRFEAPGFELGWRITLVSIAAFLVLLILSLLARFARPPIVKVKMALEDPDGKREGIESLPAPEKPIPGVEGGSMPPLEPGRPASREDLPQAARDELFGYAYDEAKQDAAPDEDREPTTDLPDLSGLIAPNGREELPPAPQPAPPAAENDGDSTGVFRPVSGQGPLPEGGSTGRFTLSGNEPAPAAAEEVYSREELDRLLKGG